MTLDTTLPVPLDFFSIEFLAGSQVAHFESQQAVDVHEAKHVDSVDREGPGDGGEWSDRAHHLRILGVSDQKKRRPQVGQTELGASSEQVVLCEPDFDSIVAMNGPVTASTMCD